MSELATIPAASAPQGPPIDAKQAKPRRISKRVAEAVRLLLSGECATQRAAAERVKMNASHLCEQLRKPNVLAFIEQQTRVTLAQSQLPAAATLIRLVAGAASEHVQKDVAIHLLSIAGHKPANTQQVSVNIDIKAGYVIDLSPGPKVIEGSATRTFPTDTGNDSQ